MSFPLPSEIVAALDRQVVGQDAAKRAVARALRNRWRQSQIGEPPNGGRIHHHLLFAGGTGLGKSTLARSAARIVEQPFARVQVSRFTDRREMSAARIIVDSLAAAEMAGQAHQATATSDDLRNWLSESIIVLEGIDRLAGDQEDDLDVVAIQSEMIPLLDGDVVNSRLGPVSTAGSLIIVEGAFRTVRPADLLPELASRIPTVIEFDDLEADDLAAILARPSDGMLHRWQELLAVDDIAFRLDDQAVGEIVKVAVELNTRDDDLGARRLEALLGAVLEPLTFDVDSYRGNETLIDRSFVQERLAETISSDDLDRFIL